MDPQSPLERLYDMKKITNLSSLTDQHTGSDYNFTVQIPPILFSSWFYNDRAELGIDGIKGAFAIFNDRSVINPKK